MSHSIENLTQFTLHVPITRNGTPDHLFVPPRSAKPLPEGWRLNTEAANQELPPKSVIERTISDPSVTYALASVVVDGVKQAPQPEPEVAAPQPEPEVAAPQPETPVAPPDQNQPIPTEV